VPEFPVNVEVVPSLFALNTFKIALTRPSMESVVSAACLEAVLLLPTTSPPSDATLKTTPSVVAAGPPAVSVVDPPSTIPPFEADDTF
jgi:hypothetical protein